MRTLLIPLRAILAVLVLLALTPVIAVAGSLTILFGGEPHGLRCEHCQFRYPNGDGTLCVPCLLDDESPRVLPR